MDEKILIVEDEKSSRELIKCILKKKQYTILEAENGNRAIEIALKELPLLIILDIMMPELNGYQTCMLLKENEKTKNIPVLFLSAKYEIKEQVKGLKLGALDFITKPVQPDILLSKVKTFIELRTRELQQRKLEEKLRKSEKMQALGQLAGGIAHDFNNILTGILGYSDILLQKLPPQSEFEVFVQNILNAGNRARNITKQILMFSRKSKAIKRPVYIGEVIREVVELVRVSQPTSINIICKLKQDMVPVLVDPSKIHEVMLNLCTNASYAIKNNGKIIIELEEVHILTAVDGCIGSLNPGYYSVIKVKDDGEGIDEKDLSHIFEPFFTTKEDREGVGMGLSVVYGIVQSHKGNILVSSKLEQGTEFRIYLPKTDLPVKVEEDVIIELPHGNERILFVDDEQMLIEVNQEILNSLGYEVKTANNSLVALEFFRDNPDAFDLVIADQGMPLMSGFELSENILSIRKDIPIIVCTGYIEESFQKKAESIGINALCMKPLARREIATLIRSVLEGNFENETIFLS